jgi:hypothetical protein
MAEQQQATKKRKLDQVSKQQSELDIDCNGGCYYIVTTNEDQLNYFHQFLLPEKIYNDYATFISNFNPKIDVSDYEPFSNKEILSFKDLGAIKDFFKQCDLAFPGEDSKHYDEDAPFDSEFTFDYLWLKVVEYWLETNQVIKLNHGNRNKNVQELNVLQIVFDYDN